MNESSGYVVAEIEPVKSGTHCWRVILLFHAIQTKNPKKGWIMWGICQKEKHSNVWTYKSG